mmetsp:Transcript_9043/g.12003  ORF Transcript_9043/g.12003 Transcript_9043/m.12003 type:complete len:184 (+) Transcript_9043:144-695(+)
MEFHFSNQISPTTFWVNLVFPLRSLPPLRPSLMALFMKFSPWPKTSTLQRAHLQLIFNTTSTSLNSPTTTPYFSGSSTHTSPLHYNINNNILRKIWPDFSIQQLTQRLEFEKYEDLKTFYFFCAPKLSSPPSIVSAKSLLRSRPSQVSMASQVYKNSRFTNLQNLHGTNWSLQIMTTGDCRLT